MSDITKINDSDYYLNLSNGKKLCFAQYGDINGNPLFFFHGWPSSRLQAKVFDKLAKELKIRIISPDRPGYGLSSLDDNRSLLSWADIIAKLADALNIESFTVLGNSGGGPYSAACAYKLLDRITKVGICVGLAPTNIEGVLEGMSFINKITWRSYYYVPLLITLSPFVHYLKQLILPNNTVETFLGKADKAIIDQRLKEAHIRNRKEAYRQGIKGAAYDLKLYTTNWGFDLRDIKVPVYLWYGGKDKNVSVEMGRSYERMIPKSKLNVFSEDGHLLLENHTKEIFSILTS